MGFFTGSTGAPVVAGVLVGGQPDVRAQDTPANGMVRTSDVRTTWGPHPPDKIERQFNPNVFEYFAGLHQFSSVQTESNAFLAVQDIPRNDPLRLQASMSPVASRSQIPSVFVPTSRG